MTNLISNFEMFVEKNEQKISNSEIKKLFKNAVKDSFNSLIKAVRKAKSLDELKELSKKIPSEIDNLKDYLKGNIHLSLNESKHTSISLNQLAMLKDKLKTLIKNSIALVKDNSKSKTNNDILKYKKDMIDHIKRIKNVLYDDIKHLDINIEKNKAKISKLKGQTYKPQLSL